ncbi:rRNA-processing protein EFG1 [Madurella mycetomatis]|uniref:rRNA-processing protein EFG1 n=1 Tax=Madurella mycetomatis TaxID=100816 RepID=A0A175VZJ8_9PEZI|nr:rRNA-processing protein EFG1 [Madurella mycetomatis]
MGKKRPHPGAEFLGNDLEGAARKRHRTNRGLKARPKKPVDDSLNGIKKRARAIERLLARDNLKIPANKQNELERELAAHRERIAEARAKKERSKMIQKYHMVRFFERKKAMRLVRQLEKKLAQTTDPDEAAQLKADLHVAQVDIDYARYFPFMEPYVSLYAKPASGEKDAESTAAQYLRSPRPPIWAVIEKIREEGEAALERLQNTRAQDSSSTTVSQQLREHDTTVKHPSPTKGTKKRISSRNISKSKLKSVKVEEEAGRLDDDDESGDSDGGGFFEED